MLVGKKMKVQIEDEVVWRENSYSFSILLLFHFLHNKT